MNLSCCVWAMDFGKHPWMRFFRKGLNRQVSETSLLSMMAELGFKSVDIQPYMQKSEASTSALKDHGLNIACMSLSFCAPDGATLHSRGSKVVESMMNHFKAGIDHTAQLGIDCAYVVPGKVDESITLQDVAPYYAELASHGEAKGVKIGIEHFPDTALPTIEATLDFIQQIGHSNLYLLFDIGHAQISKEDPAQWLPRAGDRLLYVHLDDNDGIGDLHLPLTEGIQTRNDLKSLFKVLSEMHYSGTISLELHPKLPDPFRSLKESKRIVEELCDFG